MELDSNSKITSQMRKGMLEYCILLIMQHGRFYPSDIITKLQHAGMSVVEGTIYTLLNRLRKEGKLNYEWVESTMGPPRKYFSITPLGQETLDSLSQAWEELSNTIISLKKPVA